MDRKIVYPGAIPLDTDNLTPQVDAMTALGYLAQATIGSSTAVDGLAISQTTVASMTVNVAPGSIFALETIDPNAFGSLGTNAAPVVKIGINTGQTQFTLTAPGTSGQSINYLIEASFAESDTSAVVLPYYNSSDPAVPYSGPANSGAAQNTQRIQRVSLQLKAGTAATTGTQTTPATDSGWTALYVVTVNYGQTTITNANLASALVATAPFIPLKLPQLSPTGLASANGYIVLPMPNGVPPIIIQWGNGTFPNTGGSDSSLAVTFPEAFPNNVWAVVGAPERQLNSTSGGYPTWNAQGQTLTGFIAAADGLSTVTMNRTVPFTYMAIGN